MIKVAFFLENKNIADVDCSKVAEGNPGIGGSEHQIILIASLLASRQNEILVRLYAQKQGIFPSWLEIKYVDSIENALIDADNSEFEKFIFDKKNVDWRKNPFVHFSSKIKIYPWCHNLTTKQEQDFWTKHPLIGRIICVGQEQMDLYRYRKAFYKSDYIYNCVPINEKKIEQVKNSTVQRKHNVVYIGSLVPAKSFHILAAVWKDVLKKVPDAQLFVIGNATLYDHQLKLGRYGIAEESYENEFMPYLVENGQVLQSVHFMGRMGQEKDDVLKKMKVGVPNPTGNTETFCMSAVEMQLMGCSVVAMECFAYYDTFVNGIIVKNRVDFSKKIVQLLMSNKSADYADVVEQLKKFDVNSILTDWERILTSTKLDEFCHPIEPLKNVFFKRKWCKELLRKFARIIPFIYKFL